MSGTAYNWHKWLGTNPLPFYDDPATRQATQAGQAGGLAAPKTDTGWNSTMSPFPMTYEPINAPGGGAWSAPSTQVPYTAPSTTGGAGGQALPAGFNAWQNYNRPDENAGFNYTQDPYYNAGADRPKWDLAQTGAGSEDDRSRVWRWALEQLGPDPGKRPQAEVQAAYLAAIKRLKDDYQAPENAAKGLNWANSAYAGYDQFLGGAAGGGTGASAGTSGGDTGGNTVVAPLPPTAPLGTGLVAGATAAGAGAGGPLNSIGGAELYNDPKLAWRYIMQQAGADPDYQGPFSGFMTQEYAPLMMAFLNARLAGAGRAPGAQGLAGMDQVGGMLGQFGGMLGGNDLYTRLGQAGQAGLAAGGGLLNQASAGDAENFVRQMLGLTGAGNGPLAQSAQQYLTNKMTGGYSDANLGRVQQGKFGDYLNSSGFLDRLRQFGLLP